MVIVIRYVINNGTDNYHLNVSGPCDLCLHYISTPPKCQAPRNKTPQPRHKIHTDPAKTSPDPHKYAQPLDIKSRASYSVLITSRSKSYVGCI
jgi:hypothetical protein